MTNAIFITFNEKYFQFAKKCLLSIKKNYPTHPEILVFYDGDNPNVITFLSEIPNLRTLPYNFDFFDTDALPYDPINSPNVYFRYLLWTRYFDDYDTIVYLDADTIVLQPFDELFSKTDFFAVADYTPFENTLFRNKHYQDSKLINYLAEDNLSGSPIDFQMINSGVFVIPQKYRVPEQFEKLVRLTWRYLGFTSFADQAAISLWCYQNYIPFSNEIAFNFQASFFCNLSRLLAEQIDNGFLTAEIRIFHFTWWKPQTVYYKKFLETVRFMSDIDQIYVTD